jgi:hypothetical protein
MQNTSELHFKAWVSRLWAQYSKLSEPLKQGFSNFAQSMVEETENQNSNAKADTSADIITQIQKVPYDTN